MPFAATWLDLEIIILIEGSHREKDKYHIILLIYGTKNMTQMNLSIKQKQIQERREWTCDCQGGGVVVEGELAVWN